MRKLTALSSFKDIHDLLINEDDFFTKQIKYLASESFSKGTDKGYKCRNFHFFMAVVLQGVSSSKKEHHIINFLHIIYPDPQKSTYESDTTWRRNAGDFVNGKGNIDANLNKKLGNIDENTRISCFLDGSWYELTDENGKHIFYDDGTRESIFENEKDTNGNIIGGESRAKEKMRQIVEFLLYGTQITSKGGFSYMSDSYALLKSNKQLIMNGAPGTGKTFSARNEIADKLLGISDKSKEEKEKIKEIQMDMVQFHPSYDYTDFIEGIRPNLEGTSIGYTLKNGSFKRFCRRAGVIERIIAAGEKVDESTIDKFLKGEDDKIKGFWKVKIKEESFTKEKSLPPFLFIIDEINRAEISKVLGETMFCLDTDYRGKKGRIATQYASLATEESFFVDKSNDKFFIPSNVYIIGTMNDIDRSVEVFDFALRRRFAWHEVEAECVMETVLEAMQVKVILGEKNYLDYLEKIMKLNEAIDSLLKLNRHYHLGPSYFAKIKLYLEGNDYKLAREEVWKNHILQILNEYVKGKKTESAIEQIGNAFME